MMCFSGIPSIVYGAFFTIMIYLGLKTSLAGGTIVITLLIIPIFIRSMDEIARELPQGYAECFLFPRELRVTKRSKWLSADRSGYRYKLLCCLSAGLIGDAAAVLFTAGYTDNILTPSTAGSHFASGRIFFQLSSPIPAVQKGRYAAPLCY